MEIKPVEQYTTPNYPEKPVLDEHPELLYLVPKRWHANPTVIAAFGTACVLMSGCHSTSNQKPVTASRIVNKGKSAAGVLRVAPLFIHGEGRGTFGCRIINPPVFL